MELAKKNAEKVQVIQQFKQMDEERENIIAELTKSYTLKKTIDISKLNQWTEVMNAFAAKNQLPQRKIITEEMFLEYLRNISK